MKQSTAELGRLYKCEYRGRDNLFDAVYDQIIVLDHVQRMFLQGYMLNYMDLEWDNVAVNFKSYLSLPNISFHHNLICYVFVIIFQHFRFQMIVEPNLQEIHMTYPIFRDAVRRESITGMDISLLVLSHMFNMIIGVITEDNFWISHIMLKWNEIKILIGLSPTGAIYATGT